MKPDSEDTQNMNMIQSQGVEKSWTSKQIAEASPEDILKILIEKETLIKHFSHQITRFKAQQLKCKKLINSLQQKIQKSLPSNTNTSSAFMIASEFKALFTNFMTNTVPSLFYEFADCPLLYSLLVRKTLNEVYTKIQSILQAKLKIIKNTLIKTNLSEKDQQEIESVNLDTQQLLHQEELRFHLLNYLQKNHTSIFSCPFQSLQQKQQQKGEESIRKLSYSSKKNQIKLINIQFSLDLQKEQTKSKLQGFNSEENQSSNEMKQFCQQIYQICIYMILQENPWHFVYGQNDQSFDSQNWKEQKKSEIIFSKKQFTCIDGFIKQGKSVIYVVKGLRRKQNSQKDFHYHPNIKNFVLPFSCDQQSSYDPQMIKVDIGFLQEESRQNSRFQTMIGTKEDNKLKGGDLAIDLPFNNNPLKDINKFALTERNININSTSKITQKPSQTSIWPMTVSVPLYQKEGTQGKQSQQKIHQSFKIEKIAQTQKSLMIESLQDNVEFKLSQSHSNCIINPCENQNRLVIDDDNLHQNKQNINFNINNTTNLDHKQGAQKKKEKPLVDKNPLKKNKKQKNSSAIDLTAQKRKLSQKEYYPKDILQDFGVINKRKNQELPLNRDIAKSSKHKNVPKSSKKSSIGKIVSQSTQMNSKCSTKQKHYTSQHSTMIVKQMHSKILKDNFIYPTNEVFSQENKQNFGDLVCHMYEKQVCRPKKSVKLGKTDQKQMILNLNQGQKDEKHLSIRSYQNNCLVGRLRDKYLLN